MAAKKGSRALALVPLAVGALFAALNAFDFWRTIEYQAYDMFLGIKPKVKEDPSIVLLDIDDASIDKIGSYPWPRGLLARGLESLSELGAEYVVFDIEYLEKSPMTVDSTYLDGALRAEYDTAFEEIGSNMAEVFQALADRRIPLAEAGSYGKELIGYIDETRDGLYGKTRLVAIENDSYLGKAMRLFGRAFATLNMQPYVPDEAFADRKAIAIERFPYPKATLEAPIGSGTLGFLVPIPEVASMAAGAGFTNVEIDSDGVRRRIRLVDQVEGKPYLQLAMAPLSRLLGDPSMTLKRGSLVLDGAKARDGGTKNIKIPLDSQGMMLIRWPKATYDDSFAHIPFHALLDHRSGADETATHLRRLKANQGWSLGPGYAPIDSCLEAWAAADALRQAALDSGSPEDRSAWLAASIDYWNAVDAFLAQGFGVSVPALFDKARDADDKSLAPQYDALKVDFERLYANVAQARKNHAELDARLRKSLAGSFCVIGWSSTATTDIGVNPFHKEYVNIGTHAAVANTILQEDFLAEAPIWVSSLASLILAVGVILLVRRLSTRAQILAGFGATVAVLGGAYALFHFTGVYVAVVSPALATFVSFIVYSLASFLLSEREKSFLRKAFGTYLSGDVINQIIDDPSKLKLGGEKKWMSAMFTDIRGFSTVSELLDAEQLVKLLNIYLSGMSDIILEHRGTIDKFEGDAIIAFFGAPVSYPEHAANMCESALLMKRKERELNERFAAEGLAPNPLLTRIGLNTGDMVVGNMGTERKMDYTIMGNAVNLAARLEGVNKQYGSWILMTDATKTEAGDRFIYRRLDQVRVVGINTPVQLWELVDFKSDAQADTLGFLERFDEAHRVFDSRDWGRAIDRFKDLSAERPDDGPSRSYIKKCEVFMQKPPAPDWDGVFSLTEK